jgi:hypothetical protein
MNRDLTAFAMGDKRPHTPQDRRTARAAREVVDEVMLSGLEASGALELASHILRGVRELDDTRRSLSNGADDALTRIQAEIELTAVRQVRKIQANLYTQWPL